MRGLWLALTLTVATPAYAEVTPQPGGGDPHIQSVAYDPQQVVGLHVAGGYAVTVQFAPDERIETVTVGDSTSWFVQSNHRADHLIVKPLGMAPTTNLTVITDQRAYNFTLYGAMPGEGVQPYLLSFTYPQPASDTAPSPPLPPPGRYKLSGDKALWPAEMSDDGAFTQLRWAAGHAMPAVYREEGWGRLALVNGAVRDGAYVVEGVHRRLVFMLGHARAAASRVKP